MRHCLFVVLLVGVTRGAYPGGTGFPVLKIGVGGRSAAMAGAGAATAIEASTLFANPAGLGALRGSEVYFSHNEWLQGIDHDALAAVVVGRRHAWGISVAHLAVGELELRTGPSTEPLASVSAHEVVVGVSYAARWLLGVQVGFTAKYLHDKIYLDTASGAAMDVGLRYETRGTGLVCGAALRNLGRTGRLRDERIALPFQMQAGVALPVGLRALESRLLVAADLLLERGQNARLLMGLEGVVRGIVSLRVGYGTGHTARGLSAGLGLSTGRYRIDYAYTPFEDQLGATQQVSLAIGLGKR